MADENTLRIEIDDVTDSRSNPLLDEFMGGGASPPPLPPSAPKGGPNFPATVLGPDGKAYSFDAYAAAQKKMEGQKQQAEAKSAYDAFFGPPPLPKKLEPPKTVQGADGQRYKSTDDYFKGRDAAAAAEEGGAGGFDQILNQLGLGKFGKALGGSEALSGAAGAAAAVAPALLAIEAGTKGLRTMTAAVNAVTKGLEGLANNDLSGLDEGVQDFRRELLGTIPVLGEAANAGADFAQAITSIPGKLDAAFLARAKEIGAYSAEISGAQARAEVRTTMADVQEAQELGPAMARMTDAETELKLEIRQLILPIKKFVVEVLADRLELIVKIVRIAENWPEIWEKMINTLGQVIVFTFRGWESSRDQALKLLRADLERLLGNKDKEMDLFDEFMAVLDGPPGAAAPGA